MSNYLIEQLKTSRVVVHEEANIVDCDGEEIAVRGGRGDLFMKPGAVFPYLGGIPRTAWLPQDVERDPRGYIICDRPWSHMTTMPGVFVAGDIRYGAPRRVSSAVGAGGCAAHEIDAWLNPENNS